MCRSLPASENKGGQSKQRRQKVQRHRSREKHRIGGKGKKIKHRGWEEWEEVRIQVVKNFEDSAEESGLHSGNNGESLQVSKKSRDKQAYSFFLSEIISQLM